MEVSIARAANIPKIDINVTNPFREKLTLYNLSY